MQPNNDERFENFLRQFRPRKPKPLEIENCERAARRQFVFGSLVATAAAALVVVLFIIGSHPRPIQLPKRTKGPANPTATTDIARSVAVGRLTRLMLEDPAKADAELDRVSSQLLPDVQHSKGALGALAAE